MAIYTDLSVYKSSYDLLITLYKQTKNLPREYKFTVGERLKNEITAMMIAVYKANKTRNEKKYEQIELAREHIEVIRLLVRILKDLHVWSLKQFSILSFRIEEISKQLSQWSKYTFKQKSQS
jgi:hypothetical protein